MKFAYTIIYVPDVNKAVSFYERAFGLKKRFADDSGQYAEVDTEGVTLAFASNELGHSHFPNGFRENKPSEIPSGMEIAFVTEDVKAAFDYAVKNGADAFSQPETKPWGQVVAYVRDLNGVLVEIASPM